MVCKLRLPCATDSELALGHLLEVGSDKGCESVEEEVALVVAIVPLGEYEDEVIDDLARTYYEKTGKDRTKIEDKEKTRKRLHRSPDCGDTVVYGWAPMPERPVWGVSNASWGY
ncbi:hypothetical protein H6F76_09870 [Leptolyngbya sp. FACHB-321]|uniref:hypothetical protein n=1 Tax=Leptolyngbya sp. FACHB-321 TaxID=2692807 RepID=UPI00168200D7|nr:hypothetical protein [Leptolyngbya sp. FACHB-321]MBD2035329.1 hypothetical protein [Leptolyngbya sp. FACHB-321]